MIQKLSERVHLLMGPSELKALDDWMFGHRIRSRGEAIRRLVGQGLEPSNAAPTAPSNTEVTAVPLPPGPKPWDRAPESAQLNVRIEGRLKAQVDYLARQLNSSGKKGTSKDLVEDALRAYVRERGLPG